MCMMMKGSIAAGIFTGTSRISMSKPVIIEDAIFIALQVHQGQKDKAGSSYILHPLRLMLRMRTEGEMMVAVLHDVIEDRVGHLNN